jgi:hypothetical protein
MLGKGWDFEKWENAELGWFRGLRATAKTKKTGRPQANRSLLTIRNRFPLSRAF